MVEITERLWDYDAVEPGQAAQPTQVTITAEQIAEYADIAQNPDPRYHLGNGSDEYGGEAGAHAHHGRVLRSSAAARKSPRTTGLWPWSIPRPPAARLPSPSARPAGSAPPSRATP